MNYFIKKIKIKYKALDFVLLGHCKEYEKKKKKIHMT